LRAPLPAPTVLALPTPLSFVSFSARVLFALYQGLATRRFPFSSTVRHFASSEPVSCTRTQLLRPPPWPDPSFLFQLSQAVCSQFTVISVHTRRLLFPGMATRSHTVRSQCTSVPVCTRRILLPGMATRSRTLRSQCASVTVHTRRILPGLTVVAFSAQPEAARPGRRLRRACTGTPVHYEQAVKARVGRPCPGRDSRFLAPGGGRLVCGHLARRLCILRRLLPGPWQILRETRQGCHSSK